MTGALMVIFVILTLVVSLKAGEPKDKEPDEAHDYGPPIRITSSILTFKQNEESMVRDTYKPGKYLSNGEWDEGDFESNRFLRFVGFMGSGKIYIPVASTEESKKINNGLPSHW